MKNCMLCPKWSVSNLSYAERTQIICPFNFNFLKINLFNLFSTLLNTCLLLCLLSLLDSSIVPSASQEWKKLRHYDCGEMLCNCLHRTFLLIYFWMTQAKLQRGYAIDSLNLASLYSPDPSLGFYHPPRLTIHCIFMYLFAFLPKLILLVFVFTELHCFAPFLQAVKTILNPNDNGFLPLPPLWCHI